MAEEVKRHWFDGLSRWAIRATGSSLAFYVATALVVTWALTGPIFGYSDSWQLVINTTTTIATFLMVFLIQAAQNIESRAVNVKLDEIIMSCHRARDEVLDVEMLSQEQLDQRLGLYQDLARRSRQTDPAAGEKREEAK
jgi:low affinity Fe/Cu permease